MGRGGKPLKLKAGGNQPSPLPVKYHIATSKGVMRGEGATL